AAIEYLNSFLAEHAHQITFAPAFIIVIPQDDYCRKPKPDKNIQQRLHLFGLAEIGKVARDDEDVRLIAHHVQLIMQGAEARWGEVQIGGGSDSHRPDYS